MSVERPVVDFSRRWSFAASHRLHVEALSAEANRAMFGKCNNPYGHGHNYTVQVTFRGPVDATTGMVLDLAALDAFAEREMMERFDHRHLNSVEPFHAVVPTTENLCIELWRVFRRYDGASLHQVRVEETGNNAFDYFGERESTENDRS